MKLICADSYLDRGDLVWGMPGSGACMSLGAGPVSFLSKCWLHRCAPFVRTRWAKYSWCTCFSVSMLTLRGEFSISLIAVGCPALWPHFWSPKQRPEKHLRGQAHTYRLQPVLLPPAMTWAVDERPRGHFVVIQQADNNHDHHCNHHNDDDDLGKLQLRCDGRGNHVNHMPPSPSPTQFSGLHFFEVLWQPPDIEGLLLESGPHKDLMRKKLFLSRPAARLKF